MTTSRLSGAPVLDLRPGEVVRVRSAEEIFSTLDEHGRLDGLPFMPEMVQFCGQVLTVDKRADKTCDARMQLRRMQHVVHLDNVRCDGAAHGGCQAACLTYWKEAWLERAESAIEHEPLAPETQEDVFIADTLMPATTEAAASAEEAPTYRCQATEVDAASTPISPWELSQYARDARNWGPSKIVRGLLVVLFNKLQQANRKLLPRFRPFGGGRAYPFLTGQLAKRSTPSAKLDLKPGDLVRIKSRDEIMKTLDHTNHNHGLSFDVEMVPYCGRIALVRGRVERIIDEHTGKMITLKSDCVVLEGVVCKADYHKFCTRSTFPFWREVWLEKVG